MPAHLTNRLVDLPAWVQFLCHAFYVVRYVPTCLWLTFDVIDARLTYVWRTFDVNAFDVNLGILWLFAWDFIFLSESQWKTLHFLFWRKSLGALEVEIKIIKVWGKCTISKKKKVQWGNGRILHFINISVIYRLWRDGEPYISLHDRWGEYKVVDINNARAGVIW